MRRVLLFAAFAGLCEAQSQSSTLNGTVSDASGALVPGVEVRVANEETGEIFRATTNESGRYTIPLIKPGSYILTAERRDFRQHRQTGIVLETGMMARIDIALELGAVTERVEVEGSAPLLQSETSAVGAVVQNRTIVNMPLLDRRAAQLVRLHGNIVQIGTTSAFAAAGGRGRNAMWTVDGGNVQNSSLGLPFLAFDPPVESLQEFNVSISNYAAELGRTGSAVVQMTTKSGSNQFRGSAYEYLRNDKLDARNFFSDSKPSLRYNLFGGSAGGPIRKNRTHFFANYEGLRVRSSLTRILNVPAPAETRGDFSSGSGAVRDPLAAGRPAFPGNIIPATRLDPAGTRLASFYPEPNVPGRPAGSSNFRRNQPRPFDSHNFVGRLDHIVRERDRLYGRMLGRYQTADEQPVFPTPGVDMFHSFNEQSQYNASGTWFHHFRPTTINEFRLTFDRRGSDLRQGGFQSDAARQLGLAGVDSEFFPRVTVPGLAALGFDRVHQRRQSPIHTWHVNEHLMEVRGNHSLKFGFEWRYGRSDDVSRRRPGGEFAFNNTATGHSLASLLLGWVQRGVREENFLIRSRANAMGAFVQDDWKITPNLTLNLGLRWDLDQPRWEQAGNRQNSFDRFSLNPVSATPGVAAFSGRNGRSKFAHNFDANNFGPRLGFAWRVGRNWVVRGGGAVLYTPQYDAATPLVAALGFGVAGDFISPDNGLTPALLLRNGLPRIRIPDETDLTAGFGAARAGQNPFTSVEFFEPEGRRNGYLETFNLNVQRQMAGNLLVEAGYLATLGHKLAAAEPRTINQAPPDRMGPGNAQARRPFPQFSNVSVISPDIGNSNYHALNLKVEKRYSAGLHFLANYTWSRFIDDVDSNIELGDPLSAFQNYWDRAADRGLSGNHISHRLVWSSVYELPVGAGRKVRLPHRFWDGVLGGWSSGLIAEFRTGSPYGVAEQVNRTNAFSASQRPNVAGDPKLPSSRSRQQSVERWFNTAAFAPPPDFTFGNAGRTAGYGPGAMIVDVSVLKDFRLREGHRLQFRVEALNAINRPNFGLPNLLRGNPAFGQITTLVAGNQARIIQLGLHYRF